MVYEVGREAESLDITDVFSLDKAYCDQGFSYTVVC